MRAIKGLSAAKRESERWKTIRPVGDELGFYSVAEETPPINL